MKICDLLELFVCERWCLKQIFYCLTIHTNCSLLIAVDQTNKKIIEEQSYDYNIEYVDQDLMYCAIITQLHGNFKSESHTII